jgi:glycerophosphoryl diester phosphodiesterase
MKFRILSALLSVIFISLIFSCSEINSDTQESDDSLDAYDLRYPLEDLLVSGHRGVKNHPEWPENCIQSFARLKKQGNLIIECDVLMSKDSVLLLMHDNTLQRTTTGNGEVQSYTWDELKSLKLKTKAKTSSFSIPTFRDVLKWAVESKTILSVDVKRSVPIEQVIDLIRAENALPYCMLISYNLRQAKRVYTYEPELMQSISIRNLEEHNRWKQSGIPADITIAFTGTRRSPATLYDALHKDGVACIFGTLGNIDIQAEKQGDKVYEELIMNGVDIFASDRPFELMDFLKGRQVQ